MRAKGNIQNKNKIAGIESQNKCEYSNGAAISMNKVKYQNICSKIIVSNVSNNRIKGIVARTK